MYEQTYHFPYLYAHYLPQRQPEQESKNLLNQYKVNISRILEALSINYLLPIN